MTDKQKIFIRGVEGRGNEVIDALKAVGGKTNWDDMISGDDNQWIYMINHEGLIDSWSVFCETGKIIAECYREIKLPEQWKDGTILFSPLHRSFAVCTEMEDNPLSYVPTRFVFSDNEIEFNCCIRKRDYRIANKKERKIFLKWLHKLGYAWDAKKKQVVNWKFKPKKYRDYFFVNSDLSVLSTLNNGLEIDADRIRSGNCFRTKEEAEAMAEKINKLLKGE